MAASNKSYADQVLEILEKEDIQCSIPVPPDFNPSPDWNFETVLCQCGVSREAISKLVAVSMAADLRREGETFQNAVSQIQNKRADECLVIAKTHGQSKNVALWAHVERHPPDSKHIEEIHRASGISGTVANFHRKSASIALGMSEEKLDKLLDLCQVSLQPMSLRHHHEQANLCHHASRAIVVMSIAKETGKFPRRDN